MCDGISESLHCRGTGKTYLTKNLIRGQPSEVSSPIEQCLLGCATRDIINWERHNKELELELKNLNTQML